MSIISKKNGESYLYFQTTSAQKFSVIDKASNELYELPSVAPTENGQVIAVNIDGTSEFVNNTALNALVADQPLVIPETGSVIISDGISSTGTNFSQDLIIRDYDAIDVFKQLNVNSGLNIQSLTTSPVVMTSGTDDFTVNNTQGSRAVFINSNSYFFDNNIITSENVILNQGKSLTLNNDTDPDNVKLYKANGANGTFFIDNQSGSKTTFKNASEYYFDNNVNIGDLSTSKTLTLNGVPITPSGGGLSAGMLRALNINQIVPTVAQTYNIVWSNLTPAEQAIWAGGSEPPIAGVNNSWGFQKLVAGTQKINWTLPFDFLTANLKFQEIQSVYAIIRLNTSSNISQEGYMWFQIQSQNTPQDAPLYRTRWNYANSASGVISQLGNTYKIYASDAIPLSTAVSNTGKGQEPYPIQSQFKSNPVDVEPTSLFSIPFSKFVGSPSGDTSAGYTSAFVQSIALNTASNINSFDFSVLAIGFNEYRWNLSYA
jgi:hypothetical protein